MERRLGGELDDRPAIHFKGVSKAGDVALRGVDLSVKRGEVFGLLGPEGAGKTLMVRLMLDLVRPDQGKVFLLGLDSRIRSVEVRRRVGHVAEGAPLPQHLTAERWLEGVARVHGVPRERIVPIARRLELDTSDRIRTMGRAARQKTAIAAAFLHEPELLVLDEPTTGLPPNVQQEFFRMVLEARARGATVCYASQAVSEVEKVCDRVAVLQGGRLHPPGTLGEWARRVRRALIVTFQGQAPAHAFGDVSGLALAEVNGDRMRFVMDGPVDPLLKALARHTVLDLATDDVAVEAGLAEGRHG